LTAPLLLLSLASSSLPSFSRSAVTTAAGAQSG
jgi:hypothetical protein